MGGESGPGHHRGHDWDEEQSLQRLEQDWAECLPIWASRLRHEVPGLHGPREQRSGRDLSSISEHPGNFRELFSLRRTQAPSPSTDGIEPITFEVSAGSAPLCTPS